MASTTKVRLRRYNGTDYDSIYLSANMDDVIDALPIEHGGTGASSSAAGVHGLITAATSLPGAAIEGTDYLPILDASGNVGKKASMGSIVAFIASYCNATINVTSPSGTAVTVSYRGSTVSTHTGTGSAVPVEANHKGTWTMTGTLNGVTNSVDVEVTGDGVYSAEITFFDNPLNTDQLTLGMNTVYFKAYPSIKWQVQHLDKCYVYLALTEMTELTVFNPSPGQTAYAGSTIAAKCTTFLNNTIPNVANYLENVTVHGVTNKVFIPSYKMFEGSAAGGDDFYDPSFSWPSASSDNRKCNYKGSAATYWLSSPYGSTASAVWCINDSGGTYYANTASAIGFRPAVKVQFKPLVNPLNTDKLTLGQHDIYFTAYPDLKWCVDHIDGKYVYLGLYSAGERTKFNQNKGQVYYSGSTLATKCTTFLNNTIPNVADYLESVTVNGVTSKVFIPSYKMFSGTTDPYGGADANDPTFDWPSASAANRIACVSDWNAITNFFWLSSPNSSSYVWMVSYTGALTSYYPTELRGFRPEVKVQFRTFVNPLNTDQLTLGQNDIYFTAYPSLKWQVQHLDGKYVYLSLTEMTETTVFGSNNIYSGSTIATKCTTFLNNTIPNVADYLENVTVEGVTNKVFIPTYYQFSGITGYGDQSGPVFDWSSASASNRICNYQGAAKVYWTSSPSYQGAVWVVSPYGEFAGSISPTGTYGFRPCVKVRYKE